jgi:hypothetical protein
VYLNINSNVAHHGKQHMQSGAWDEGAYTPFPQCSFTIVYDVHGADAVDPAPSLHCGGIQWPVCCPEGAVPLTA